MKLELSATFDLVEVKLLIRGLLMDLIAMIKAWLTNCKFYVEIDGVCSRIYESKDGTIQGLVLGPILYSIFVSPLFDLTNLNKFCR